MLKLILRAGLSCLSGLCLVSHFNAAGDTLWLSLSNHQGQLSLSWPLWAPDAVLEQSPVLDPPAWSSVSPALYQSNTVAFSYTLPTLEGNRFFRVRRLGPPVVGLTGYWQLDEGSGTVAADLTGSGNGLYITNATWAAGRFGPGSLDFKGQDLSAGGSLAWLSNSNYQVLPPVGRPFSISLWFSPDVLASGSHEIIGNDANAGNGWDVALNTSGPGTNYLVLTSITNGSSLSATGRTLLLPGQWHQLTVTCEGNQANLYLDSALLAQESASLINGFGPLNFGAVPGISGGFAGRIDEIRIYTNALTSEQVSLTGQWHFDENAGFLTADSSVQGHLASVTVSNAWAAGKLGSGIDLAVGSVVIPNDDFSVLPASGGAFSISAWLLPRALPVGRSGVFSCGNGANNGWQLIINVDNSGQSWLEFTSTNLNGTLGLQTPCALTNGMWTKLDLNYNGGIAGVYVNGRKVGCETGAIEGSQGPLIIGSVPGTFNFNGVIDELKIYNRDRADAEIGPVALPLWEMALLNTSTNLVLPGSGPVGQPLTYTLLSAPVLGTITLSPGSPNFTYKAGSQKGPDSFVYTVSDGEFTSPPATGAVSVVEPHWLSPTGGVQQPQDGSTPVNAWVSGAAGALDAIWNTNSYYDCFFYAPGVYQTTGWRYQQRSTANPGCKHLGSGSQGPTATVLQLVNTWRRYEEGLIFGGASSCDGFEIRNMVLDCNAQNNPKYVLGEPVWLRIPLTSTALVDTVTLHWSNAPIAANPAWSSGPATEFSVWTRLLGTNGYITNCSSLTSTGLADVVTVATNTDELLLQLTKRPNGVDFYGINEVEVSGAAVSLPIATRTDGSPSQLDAQHSILLAVDQDTSTSWASGPESQVQIMLPLESGTTVSQVQFHWNCQTLTNLLRLGAASQYFIFARDQNSGQLVQIPFTSGGRSAAGLETAVFGTSQSSSPVTTDQILILLTVRESGVDSYSLKEVSLQNGSLAVPMRLPTAMSTLSWGTTYSVVRAFDGDLQTGWASDTQGSVTAVDVLGSNMKFTGLKVINFGTKAKRECFPFAVIAPVLSSANPLPFRNVLVQDCLFTQPATNNSDGLTTVIVIGYESASLQNASIRNCSVTAVQEQFFYSHAFVGKLIENCFADDCQVGIYFEPDPSGAGLDSVGQVTVRSNVFQNVERGISLDFHPGAVFDSLICQGNELVLAGTDSRGWGFGACDVCSAGPSGTITNVTALNNIVRYADWAPRPAALEIGFLYSDIHHAVYGNNLVALGTADPLRVRQDPAGSIPPPTVNEDCDHPGLVQLGPSSYAPSVNLLQPGYRRAWYNNRGLSGMLLPVRYSFWGVDGLAAQQQWPQ